MADTEDFSNEVEKMPSEEDLAAILKAIAETKSKNAENNGWLKDKYDLAKDRGVNKRAVKIIATIEGIESDQDRDSLIRHLLTYLNRRGLSPQGDLFAPINPNIGHNSAKGLDDIDDGLEPVEHEDLPSEVLEEADDEIELEDLDEDELEPA